MTTIAAEIAEMMSEAPRTRWHTYAIVQGKSLDLIKTVPPEVFVAIAEGRLETRSQRSGGVTVWQYLEVPA